jgi:hypothetical protein
MSEYYNPQRTRNIYDPQDSKSFKISRSKIDLFIECPRCFYLDRRLGIGRPPGFPFTLNTAVDALLKQEFDVYRAKGEAHPLQKHYGIEAIPIAHDELDTWRENFKGIQYLHPGTNLTITGAIDDLWQNSQGEYIVVDYKATSKDGDITELNETWHNGYKRQMEIYQWLLRQKGYKVSNTGYFVYCNGRKDRAAFDRKLEFDVTLIPYEGNDSWVENSILQLHKCLQHDQIPKSGSNCDYCAYIKTVHEAVK